LNGSGAAASPPEKRAEFEATCIPFMTALYNTALRLTRRPEDASDLVQETFLRAYRTFDNFTRGTNSKAWLFTILYSIFVNWYRKERRQSESVPLEDVEERFLAARDEAARPFGDSSMGEIEAALRELPEAFRSAVLLVDVEGLSYEEAAAALACPVGTIRSRLARGRKTLFVRLRSTQAKQGPLSGT
jgi:RNA polymerase sigma-70 factor (ECF subfamily)